MAAMPAARYVLLGHVIHILDIGTKRPLCGQALVGSSNTANAWCAACQEKAEQQQNPDLVISR
jgi:hypothetical protein